MEPFPRKYSVFLSPAAADFAWCEAVIGELAAKYDCPPFEPHVTVYSVLLDSPDLLVAAVADAARGIPPFSLPVQGVGCTDEYFKTLFISFPDENPLLKLHQAIRTATPVPSDYRLVPHLSLLYAEMPLSAKQALARRTHVDRESLRFDTVKVVTPGNSEAGWRDTGRWHTVFRTRLGGEKR